MGVHCLLSVTIRYKVPHDVDGRAKLQLHPYHRSYPRAVKVLLEGA